MPKTCCSCHDDRHGYPISSDTCMCGSTYLNGWVGILSAQLLALIGMLFSIAALGDCSFMELDERLFFPADLDENLPLKVTQTQYVGFLTWQMLDGSCYFYTSGLNPNGQISEFYDILGRDWEMARVVAMLNPCLSFLFFCYLISFTCSSQVRGVRFFNTAFLSVILTGLQGITFLSFDSSFCEEYGCTFSRSAGFSAASMGCFFLSGLCFCCTTDYPGPRYRKKMPKFMAAAQVAPEQSRGVGQRMSGEPLFTQDMYTEPGIEPDIEEVMPDYDLEEDEDEEVLNDQGDEEMSDDHGDVEMSDDDGEEEVLDDEGDEEVLDDEGDDMIEEEIVEDEEGDVNDQFNTMNELKADDNCEVTTEVNTEVTDDEASSVESITHVDGSQTVTKTIEQIADEDNENKNDGDDDDFADHPDLGAGEDCELFTEVTEEEVRIVETITHVDGSQTVKETFEEVADENNRAEI